MIFAGSEFGLTGRERRALAHADAVEPARRPREETLAAYQALFGLRAEQRALRHGGLRWIHADADSLVFLARPRRSRSWCGLAGRGAARAAPAGYTSL